MDDLQNYLRATILLMTNSVNLISYYRARKITKKKKCNRLIRTQKKSLYTFRVCILCWRENCERIFAGYIPADINYCNKLIEIILSRKRGLGHAN